MHNAPVGMPVITTVAALSDHLLLQRVKELSPSNIEAVVSDHLCEIERRRLYLTLGCSSMFDYAVLPVQDQPRPLLLDWLQQPTTTDGPTDRPCALLTGEPVPH